MIDPILVYKMKTWYNGLYRGERYLVCIGLFLIVTMILLWATNDTFSERKTPKPIILQGKY